jgi:hypothetical protein
MPARLVDVSAHLGDRSQIEGDAEQHRFGRVAALTGGQRCLQHPPRPGRVARLAVQPGQRVQGRQDVGVIVTVRRPRRHHCAFQQVTGRAQVTVAPEGQGVAPGGGQRRGRSHVRHARWRAADLRPA